MSSEPTNLIRIQGPSSLAELFLINARYEVVARGVGSLEATVPTGLYFAKTKVGESETQETILVDGSKTEWSFAAPEPLLASPVPLPRTLFWNEAHAKFASDLSGQPAGPCSLVFIVREADASRPWRQPGIGASVCDMEGRFIARLHRHGQTDPSERIGGVNLGLMPGPYRLRVNSKHFGTYERVVWLKEGLQTQVFAIRNSLGFRGQRRRMTDLLNASVLYAPLHEGFVPDPDPESAPQVSEAVAAALFAGRPTVPDMWLRESQYFARGNPLLGLMGAYLALIQAEPDRGLVEHVAHDLTSMVPDWPDLLSLREWLGLDIGTSYRNPPMLKRSWEMILNRATTNESTVPGGSLLSQIAPRILSSGPWLTWQYSPEGTGQRSESGTRLPDVVRRLKARQPDERAVKRAPVQQYLEQSIEFSEREDEEMSLEELARNMNLPLSSVDGAVAELADELEAED